MSPLATRWSRLEWFTGLAPRELKSMASELFRTRIMRLRSAGASSAEKPWARPRRRSRITRDFGQLRNRHLLGVVPLGARRSSEALRRPSVILRLNELEVTDSARGAFRRQHNLPKSGQTFHGSKGVDWG